MNLDKHSHSYVQYLSRTSNGIDLVISVLEMYKHQIESEQDKKISIKKDLRLTDLWVLVEDAVKAARELEREGAK